MHEQCLFCEIYKNKKDEIIVETNYFFIRFDRFPVSPGHLEIIPKKHRTSIFDLSKEEWIELFLALKKAIQITESTDFEQLYTSFLQNPVNEKSADLCKKMLTHCGLKKKPDGYNIGNNEGEAAGRTIHHLHIHIIPRYFGDVENPRGGIRHIIPGLGNY